jgi:hypothetical protein
LAEHRAETRHGLGSHPHDFAVCVDQSITNRDEELQGDLCLIDCEQRLMKVPLSAAREALDGATRGSLTLDHRCAGVLQDLGELGTSRT